MSTTRYGAGASSSAVAPRNDSAASSSPESSSGVTPSASRAAVKNSSRLVASRAALVAVARTWVTPCSASASRYSRSTAVVRSIASGASARASTPWPRRVMRMRRSSGTTLASRGDVPSTSATSRRTELVPMSTAATRLHGAPRREFEVVGPATDGVVAAGEEVGVVGVEALDAHPGAADTPGRGGARGGRPGSAASRSAAYASWAVWSASGSTAAWAARTPPAASRRATATVELGRRPASTAWASGCRRR